MTAPLRRRRSGYFPFDSSVPAPLLLRVRHRVRFSEVDPMAVMWHGRYAKLFEQANEDLGKLVGLGYADFHREKLRAPIVQLHVDYFAPTILGEDVEVLGRLVWNEGARLNMEYEIHKPDKKLAATGYTVQMFVEEAGSPLLASPALLENCRGRWRAGEFKALQ
jgi:acyl-CoA thioester hydrolase